MGSIGQTHWPNLRRPTCPIVLPAVLLSEFLSGLSEVASLEIPVRLAEEIVLPFCPVWVGRISTMPRPIFLVRLSIVRISNPTQVSSRHKSIGQQVIERFRSSSGCGLSFSGSSDLNWVTGLSLCNPSFPFEADSTKSKHS